MALKAILALSAAFGAMCASADLWMAGDSTMCNYAARQYPQQGWGQALAEFMKNPDELHNWAVGGRSAKSYKSEGRWQRLVDSLKAGDFVIVAFGHNDAAKAKPERHSSPADYKALMAGFAADVKAKGATIVFATSIPHSGGISKDENGVTRVRGGAAGIGPYVAATVALGEELGVPVLDLNRYACAEFAKMGKEAANRLYMRIAPNEYRRFPKGKVDGCHTRDTGAFFFAKAAVELAYAQKLPVAALFKDPASVVHAPIPWGGPGSDAKPLKDDFTKEEVGYANEEAAKKDEAKKEDAKKDGAKGESARKPTYPRAVKPISQTNDAPAEVKSAPLFRKKIAVLGDSYVQNHHRPIEETWHYRLAEKYQMTYLNYGRNGNTMIFDNRRRGVAMKRRFAEIPSDVDYLVVIAGHNDAYEIDRLGGKHTVADSEETIPKKQAKLAAFKAGVPAFVEKLKARFPKAKIAFVTPWGLKRPYFAEVIDAIKLATAAAGVACYDAAALSGIDVNSDDVRAKWFQEKRDTAHLNADGHAVMLGKVEPFFLGL